MEDVTLQGGPARPVRTWRPMILWSGGIVLALGLTWFTGAVVVPYWQVRSFVKSQTTKMPAWERLGGERRACERLRRYICLPDPLATNRDWAVQLLAQHCDGGADAVTALLHDERTPLETRLAIIDCLGCEWDSEMDKREDWRPEALFRVLSSPSGQVRIAAARGLVPRVPIVRDEGSDRMTDAGLAQLAKDLRAGDSSLRLAAARALHSVAEDLDKISFPEDTRRFRAAAEPTLKAALADPDPAVRAEAAEALKHKLGKATVRWGGPGE